MIFWFQAFRAFFQAWCALLEDFMIARLPGLPGLDRYIIINLLLNDDVEQLLDGLIIILLLGNLILSFSKLLNQKAIHKPSAQHVLDDEYYRRIEAIQFTMYHDDGKKLDDINQIH